MTETIEWWGWIVLGIVFVTVELVIPAAFFLGLGAASLAVGLVVLAVPALDLETQLLFFSAFALISIVLAKRFIKNRAHESDQPLLNRRGHQYVGRKFTLEEPIINGQGKIRVDDSTWKINGGDCETGVVVSVTGVDGVVLQVEHAD
jgi:membrane protein implicated in regulation of membrane protease activity